jgi:hypothetical protein
MATTLDQVIAKIIGQETPLPSLEVAAETTVQSAAGGGGYYSRPVISSPVPRKNASRDAFQRVVMMETAEMSAGDHAMSGW